MTIAEIAAVLEAQWLCCQEEGDRSIHYAFASDMMSDVLAHVQEDTLLLTGLVNPQVVRTAEMMDMVCIVFVRSKCPTEEMIRLAESHDMVLLKSKMRMYEACGKLYANGLIGNGELK